MINAAEYAFSVVVDNIYFLNQEVDLRDLIRLCALNKSWQKAVADQKGFWDLLRKSVRILHTDTSEANLKAHIGENIQEIQKIGFELPLIFGIEQIKFMNQCARTFARMHLYAHEDQLEVVPEHVPSLTQLQMRVNTLFSIYLNPMVAEERQQLVSFPATPQKSFRKQIFPTALITHAHAQIIAVADTIDQWIEAHRDNFARVKIKHCNFEHACSRELPHEIGLFVGLKKLSLYYAIKIPEEIAKLPLLDTLMIDNWGSKENLHAVPDCILQMTRLKKLNLIGCKISKLPEKFYQLSNLKRLSLKRNCFDEFPTELFKLKKLKFLTLTYNQISKVGNGIKGMHSLEGLALQYNKITTLPKSIASLPLKRLTLNQNPIASLPEGLAIEQLRRPLNIKPTKSQSKVKNTCEYVYLEKYLDTRKEKLNIKHVRLKNELNESPVEKKRILEAKLARVEKGINHCKRLESKPFKLWKTQNNAQRIEQIKARMCAERRQAMPLWPEEVQQFQAILNELGDLAPQQYSAVQPFQIVSEQHQTLEQMAPIAEENLSAWEYNRKEQELKMLMQIENNTTIAGAVSTSVRGQVFSRLNNLGALGFQQHKIDLEWEQTLEVLEQHYALLAAQELDECVEEQTSHRRGRPPSNEEESPKAKRRRR